MGKDKDPESCKFMTLNLDIEFPFQPYTVQKSMMNHVARTLKNKHHALLESPTGTGKTLALLCSSLAWQRKSNTLNQPFISDALRKEQGEKRLQRLMSKPCSCGRRTIQTELDELKEAKGKNGSKKCDFYNDSKVQKDFQEDEDDESALKKQKLDCTSDGEKLKASPYFKKNVDDDDDDDDVIIIEDEIEQCKRNGAGVKQTKEKETEEKETKDRRTNCNEFFDEGDMCMNCQAVEAHMLLSEVLGETKKTGEDDVTTKIPIKVPRIYYGTRTHKQITQVVREVNKTIYKKKLKMCILSSRERTCINPDVKDLPNRNDKCQELLKTKSDSTSGFKKSGGGSCPYYDDSNTNQAKFEGITEEFETEAWDIEDAAEYGRRYEACPYYGIRSLQENADITFCPYNYLLDPTIRRLLDIKLNNAIVIFDEAHNIEDICRDSASFIINTKQIDEIVESINIASKFFIQGSLIADAHRFFKDKLEFIAAAIKNTDFDKNNTDGDAGEERKVLTPGEMSDCLKKMTLGPDSLGKVKENLKALRGDDEDEKSKKTDDSQSNLSSNQMQFITQLCITLEFMYISESKNYNDFRAVITKSLNREHSRAITQKGNSKPDEIYIYQLSLLCMNPGIAFEKVHSQAWSVIVASGTLSPIESLKSELGCKFTNIYTGAHVVDADRIFASILTRGPDRNVDLNCNFANSLRLDFQDQVGEIISDVCQTVPNGVLVFFPSYDRMANLYQRWSVKGLVKKIAKAKKIFMEKKNLSPSEFELELQSYHNFAKSKGALLFAVFRGKVSEGIDFADMAARAVITIGIPYPNFKEVTVSLKQSYNDAARSQRPELMTGKDWYTAQAYRALNQALGRCIRHKQDWGAIIMIDSRLQYGVANISKWLSKVVHKGVNYSIIRERLKDFVRTKSLED